VQFDTDRDLLAKTVREVRAAVATANRDYPDRYLADAEARAEGSSASERERQQRLDADRAVIDEAMR
jgi:hypothetical protein